MNPGNIIQQLQLIPHPEGGLYRETYRADKTIQLEDGKIRNTGTAIYYFLQDNDKSHFHRVGSDECWFFHQGEPLDIFIITEDGSLLVKVLGNNFETGEEPQVVIKANTWFAAKLKTEKGYTLVSCTVAPGFDFADYEIGNRQTLSSAYPGLDDIIGRLSLE